MRPSVNSTWTRSASSTSRFTVQAKRRSTPADSLAASRMSCSARREMPIAFGTPSLANWYRTRTTNVPSGLWKSRWLISNPASANLLEEPQLPQRAKAVARLIDPDPGHRQARA